MARVNSLISWIIFITIAIIIADAKQTFLIDNPFNSTYQSNSSISARFASPGLVFPGTKWCGPGDIAANNTDFGRYEDTDVCCRDHDTCDNMLPGTKKYGLVNDDWFTRLHCDCDKNLFECLHNSKNAVSDIIGTQYFFVRSKCYKEAYPVIKCLEYQNTVFSKRCIKYLSDTTKPKIYQWFDIPYYNIKSFPDLQGDPAQFYKRMQEFQQQLYI